MMLRLYFRVTIQCLIIHVWKLWGQHISNFKVAGRREGALRSGPSLDWSFGQALLYQVMNRCKIAAGRWYFQRARQEAHKRVRAWDRGLSE